MSKKVRLSLSELYFNNIRKLKYGGTIHYFDEEGEECYALKNKYGLIACEDEEFEIESKTSEHVILVSTLTKNIVWLSIEEYNIGVGN